MVNWTNVLRATTNKSIVEGVRIIAGQAKKGIVEGVRTIADETKQGIEENRKKRQIGDRKRQIVDRMYPAVIKKLALDRGIHPETLGYAKIDDFRDAVVAKIPLNDLIDFAIRKRIFIRDIQDEINKEVSEQEEQKLAKEDSIGEDYRKVLSR